MKFIHLATLAVAGLLSASPAGAETFDDFIEMCVNHDGDASRAATAARKAGWTQMPAEIFGAPDEGFHDPALFISADPSAIDPTKPPSEFAVLITGWGSGKEVMGVEDLVMDICGVASPTADAADLERRMSAHLKQPVSDLEEFRVWFYSRDGDRFVSEVDLAGASDEVVIAAARQRQLYVIYAMGEDQGAQGLLVGALRSTR